MCEASGSGMVGILQENAFLNRENRKNGGEGGI